MDPLFPLRLLRARTYCKCTAPLASPFPLGLINFREKGKEEGEKIRKGKEIKPWGQNRGGTCFVSILKIPGERARVCFHVSGTVLKPPSSSLDLSARRCNLRARRRDTDKCKRWTVPVGGPTDRGQSSNRGSPFSFP